MNIRPSASIRQNYNEIAELCRSTMKPVFLTKNGEGDLVVMDIETFEKRKKNEARCTQSTAIVRGNAKTLSVPSGTTSFLSIM